MTFGSNITEIYMYVREIDDGQMRNWSVTPQVVQTTNTALGGNYVLGSLIYDSVNNIVRDYSKTGEGIDLGSPGISPFNFGTTNPSAAGVLKFSDPNGFSSLSWTTELAPGGGGSDGFQISFATDSTTVPEPSGAMLLGLAGAFCLLRRRR